MLQQAGGIHRGQRILLDWDSYTCVCVRHRGAFPFGGGGGVFTHTTGSCSGSGSGSCSDNGIDSNDKGPSMLGKNAVLASFVASVA